jgi:nucleoside-diphosphate-sugar epimerase
MQIVVIGGCGVLGQALLKAIVERGVLTRADGVPAPVRRVIAVDRSQPARLFVEARVEYVRAEPGVPRLLQAVMGVATDAVFHAWDAGAGAGRWASSFALADSLRDLLAVCAQQSSRPKVVLASSFAADCRAEALSAEPQAHALPASRNGMTALVGELLLEEARRDGRIDGRALRLPMVAGAPGCAGFLATLVPALREGRAASCPIPLDAPMWLTSASAAARALVHAHELAPAAWATIGVPNAPGRTLSVDSLVQALMRSGGQPVQAPGVGLDAPLSDEVARHPHWAAADTALTLGFEDAPDAEALALELAAAAAQ